MKCAIIIFMILGYYLEPAYAQNMFEYNEVDFLGLPSFLWVNLSVHPTLSAL